MPTCSIALLPGDGIGPEVMGAAVRVLRSAEKRYGFELAITEGQIGTEADARRGTDLPIETVKLCRAVDGVLIGPVARSSSSQPTAMAPPRHLVQELHGWLGVYANLRPIRVFPALVQTSPLRPERVSGVDVLVVRDASAGLYYGQPRGIEAKGEQQEAHNTSSYTEKEIARVARLAFEAAMSRRRRLVLADWSKILETGVLWKEVTTALARAYPEVAFEVMDTDTCVLELLWHPKGFDVILGDIMTGDLLSAQAAAISGTFALHPSAFISDRMGGLYAPGHGTAPDLVGKGFANPTAAILAAAMLLDHALALPEAALGIRGAIERALARGARTHDLSITGEVVITTQSYTDRVIAELESGEASP